MKLTFLGGAGTVTGSKYLVEDDNRRVLVDCGLFQGRKELRLRNWGRFPVEPSSLHAVILTHAHLDHSGYIPLLVREGFRGSIYCSEGTRDFCSILLPDSGHIQEEDAETANRHGYSKHRPAMPLYTEEDARRSLDFFKPVSFGALHTLGEEMSFSLHHAGHILGAAFVRLVSDGGTSVLFSGDLGRADDPVMKAPAHMQDADYLIVESTYGDRVHGASDPAEDIRKAVHEAVSNGGTVLIPAFAVARTQSILYYLYKLKSEGKIRKDIPIYLDSPMAINASELMHKHMSDHRLSSDMCSKICSVAQYTRTREESRGIDANDVPKIIISASGMATGGRILHHMKRYLGDRRSCILLAGYQAAGTRGDRLVRGEKEIKIHGQMWPVRAKVVQLDNMSAHADSNGILAWLGHFSNPPRKTFITHGEPMAAESLRQKIETTLGWEAVVAADMQREEF